MEARMTVKASVGSSISRDWQGRVGRRTLVRVAAAPLVASAFGIFERAYANDAKDWKAWTDLVNFLPSRDDLNKARTARGRQKLDFDVQRIEDASKPKTNLDLYEVLITKLPTTGPAKGDAKDLYGHLRRRLTDFLDPQVSELVPYEDGDGKEWNSITDPPLGCAMIFNIRTFLNLPDERGAVVVSSSSAMRWQFTPIKLSLPIGTHPVAGNREFGLRPGKETGTYVFYTRAADRAFDLTPPESVVLSGAQKLWQSMQARVSKFISENGGKATISKPIVYEPSFETLKKEKIFTRS